MNLRPRDKCQCGNDKLVQSATCQNCAYSLRKTGVRAQEREQNNVRQVDKTWNFELSKERLRAAL